MRKIIVLSFISLDGVMQAPGGPEEDTSGGFKYGGWTAPYDDEVAGEMMQKHMEPADILLGRKTYDIFAGYWPGHADAWPGINDVTKYVLSNTIKDPIVNGWANSVVLRNVADIENLKKTNGSDLKIWGSSELVHLLLKHDLIDELWLMTYPIVLGKGKKLFDTESVATAFTLTDSTITSSGVVFANYKRAGEVEVGTVGA